MIDGRADANWEGMMNHNDVSNEQPGATVGTDRLADSPGILLEMLWRHRWIILLTSGLSLVAAYVAVRRMTPLYVSTSRIYVEKEIPRIIKDSAEGIMTQSTDYLQTQTEVLHSTRVLTTALESLDPQNMLTFTDTGSPLSTLSRNTAAKVGKKDGIINVSFKSPYPAEAAKVVNAVVDAYVLFNSDEKRRAIARLLKILREHRIELSEETGQKLEKMREFERQNRDFILAIGENNNVAVRRLEELSREHTTAQLTTMQAKSYYEKAQTMAHDPMALRQLIAARRGGDAGTVAGEEATSLRTEVKNLKDRRTEVLQELKPNHPLVAALDANIERILKEIAVLDDQFVQRQLDMAKQEYLLAKQWEEELEKQIALQSEKVRSLHDVQAEYARLQADSDHTRMLSDPLDDRIQELEIVGQVGGLTISVLEKGGIPGTPSEPQATKAMAMALILGICGGIGLAFVRELSDKRIRSSQEIATLLRIPVLGTVPAMRSFLRNGTLRAQMVRVCRTSPEAEAFRRLRTPFLLGLLSEKAKTIVVTSPVSGEGKSLLVSNLATAMAEAGQKVLIVDADCHTPSQHKIFKKDRQAKGLSLVLAGQMTAKEAIEPTRTGNLDILTCGPAVSNSTEMLAGDRWRQLVTTLAGQYDRVLIDSPPLLFPTDTPILAAQCDGVVLVLRANTSTRKDSVQACDELTGVGARILGVVVNAVPRKRGRYTYGYSRYGRYYGRPVEAIPRTKSETRNKEGSPFEQLSQERN